MFDFNKLNIPSPYDFYLVRADGNVLGELNAIVDDTASMTMNVNNQYELTFEYNRFITLDNGQKLISNLYDFISYGMYIYSQEDGLFRLGYPTISYDGSREFKQLTAVSAEVELEDKDVYGLSINTGKVESAENLVEFDDTETEPVINSQTGLPYDYMVLHCTYHKELEKIKNKYFDGQIISKDQIDEITQFCKMIPRLKHKELKDEEGNISYEQYVTFVYDHDNNVSYIVLSNNFNGRVNELIKFYTKYWQKFDIICYVLNRFNCAWTIGNVDESYNNKKYQFDVDGTNVYAFFTQDVSEVAECIFLFDRHTKKINIISAENLGEETGIIIDKVNLMNSVDISCDEDKLYTRYYVTGGDDNTDIAYVNFGENYIVDLTYFINATDENGKRIYFSDALAEKYSIYMKDRETAREPYIELTKQYNQLLIDISELNNRVPTGNLTTNWGGFTEDELNKYLTQYNNMLTALVTMYKEDYPEGFTPDGEVNEEYMSHTEYYNDYKCYQNIITQIGYAIIYGENYTEIDDPEIKKEIEAYKTDWKLYGVNELKSKIKVYENTMKVFADNKSVILMDGSDHAIPWDNLTLEQKASYNMDSAKYAYNEYMEALENRNGAKAYLSMLQREVDALKKEQHRVRMYRNLLVKLVNIETYDRWLLSRNFAEYFDDTETKNSFTKQDIETIYLFYYDTSYSNQNYSSTSLDDIVSVIDIEMELLKKAQDELSIDSQPQLSFSTTIDNLLCNPYFKDFKFYPGNYVYVQYYDDYYIKLRLSKIQFNPRIPSNDVTIEFTNYITSKSKRTDIASLLSLSSGGSKSSRSTGGSSGDGTFGDVDITISNTMLARLLNTDELNNKISNAIVDTLKLDKITSQFPSYSDLNNMSLNANAITYGLLKSRNYNGTNGGINNTDGSAFSIENGEFNFAGGALVGTKKDDSYKVVYTGEVNSSSGNIGGFDIDDDSLTAIAASEESEESYVVHLSKYKDENSNVIAVGSYDKASIHYGDCSFRVKYNGDTYIENLTVKKLDVEGDFDFEEDIRSNTKTIEDLRKENEKLNNRLIAVEAFLTTLGFVPYQEEGDDNT